MCYYTTKPTYIITNAISVSKKTKENKGKGACQRLKKHTNQHKHTSSGSRTRMQQQGGTQNSDC
jgi:stalled ribosome alternative rescue factor ArfA